MTRNTNRLQQVRLMLALEQVLQPKSERQLRKELRSVALLVEHAEVSTTTLLVMVGDLLETFRPTWVKLLSVHYQRTGMLFGNRLFMMLTTREKKDMRDTFRLSMSRFIARWGLDKARKITAATRDFVREKILKGIADGLGTREIARSFREQITGIGTLNPVQRAEVIARTETHTAANYAQREAVRAIDLPGVQKEWLAVEDARTRESHAQADGQVVGMDEPFVVGGAHLMFPGDPDGPAEEIINCRCVIAFIGPEGDTQEDE